MSSLKGKTISRTYQKLIQSDNEITDSFLKQISTGSGIPTSLKLSTTKAEVKKLGVGTDGETPDGLLHVLEVSAGAVTSSTSANQLTLENSTNCGLSILSGSSSFGNIYFGDVDDNNSGSIFYDHSNESLSFATNSETRAVLNKRGDLSISGTLTEGLDRYSLTEYFHDLPMLQLGNVEVTQDTSGTTAVTQNSRLVRITTASIDLAATDSVEFTLNNNMIQDNSHVLAYVINSSGTIADNAMVSVMVHDVDDASCKIRLSTNAVDVAAQTYEIHVTVDPHLRPNGGWQLSGTNVVESRIGYGSTVAGIKMQTAGADNDQLIVSPKTGSDGIYKGGPHVALANVSPWTSNFFTPVSKETSIQMPITTSASVADMAFWGGWKITTTGAYATDLHQAYFIYVSNDDLGAFNTNGNLHFVYSIAGADYITDLGIVVAADTTYRLRIDFDQSFKASVFVNGVQYGLINSATLGGATESNSTQPSLTLSSTQDLIPVLGVQALTSTNKDIHSHFIKATRNLT
jgi:hypothetical protein